MEGATNSAPELLLVRKHNMRENVIAILHAIRIKDWSVQVLIHSLCAQAYFVSTDQPIAPYLTYFGWTTLYVAVSMAAGYLFNNVADFKSDQGKERPYLRTKRHVTLATVAAVILVVARPKSRSSHVRLCVGTNHRLVSTRCRTRLFATTHSTQGAKAARLTSASVTQRVPAFLILAIGAPTFDAMATLAISAWLAVVGAVFIVEHQLEDLDSDIASGTSTWMTENGRSAGERLRRTLYYVDIGTSYTLAVFLFLRSSDLLDMILAVSWLVVSRGLSRGVQHYFQRQS